MYRPYKSQTAIAKINIVIHAICFYKERKYEYAECGTCSDKLMSNII
jgi:hypothetical protein